MSELFYKRYSRKSDAELLQIINNSKTYQKEAVKAAALILEKRRQNNVSSDNLNDRVSESIEEEYQHLDEEFFSAVYKRFKAFAANYSIKEVFSCFSLSFLYIAVWFLIDYFYGLPGIIDTLLKVFYFTSIMALNHIFYKKENGVSNNFIGRLIQDMGLLSGVIVILYSVQGLLPHFSFIMPFAALIFLVAIVVLLELVLTLINLLFRRLSWEIW